MNDQRDRGFPQKSPNRMEKGQSIVILAAVFVALIAIVGLAIDLGLVYVERVKIARAVDAAALAAVHELPNEAAAHLRAVEYLGKNGYTQEDCLFQLYGPLSETRSIGNEASGIVFQINTGDYEVHEDPADPLSPLIPNSAYRVAVTGTVPVEMNFMRLLGRSAVPVNSNAVAESVNTLDVTVVLDDSGSMDYETVCHGCYEPLAGHSYPTGTRYTLSFPNTLCDAENPPQGYIQDSGHYYITIEAEHYSRYEPDYHGAYKDPTISYWAMQRNGKGDGHGNDSTSGEGDDGHRPYMRHNPFDTNFDARDTSRSLDDVVNHPQQVPHLDYKFLVPQAGNYYVWVRGERGSGTGSSASYQADIYWSVDDSAPAASPVFPTGGYNQRAPTNWGWRRLGSQYLHNEILGQPVTHTLEIWAGGMGFKLDKIVITNNNANPPGPIDSSSKLGPDESARLFGLACNLCSVPYGNGPSQGCTWDNQNDDMFSDKQPIRTAKEAIKNFASKLDPQYDQFGFVRYDTHSSIGWVVGSSADQLNGELHCLVLEGQDDCEDEYELAYEDVLAAVANAEDDGSTNISDAMWDGIRVLMSRDEGAPVTSDPDNLFKVNGAEHYGRAQAKSIMVLVTDGRPNTCASKCDNSTFRTNAANRFGKDSFDDFWPDNIDRDYDCIIYFAYAARNNLVTVYTIGLGDSVDDELLTEAAQITGGAYYNAPDRERLQDIFDEIFDRIYVRLVK